MLNLFDIFKMIIGIVVFVVVITMFFRIANTYSGLGETGIEYDTVTAFDNVLKSTYTSKNPGEFQGFDKLDSVEFAPPLGQRPADPARIRFSSGQKLLSVPSFVLLGEGGMVTDLVCEDYEWFSFCYVLAMPAGDIVVFSSLDATPATRNFIEDTVLSLPAEITVGYCDGSGFSFPPEGQDNREAFINSLGAATSPCTAQIPEGYWLVTVGGGGAVERGVSVNPNTMNALDSEGETRAIGGGADAIVMLSAGALAVDHKDALFRERLATETQVMRRRAILVHSSMQELNAEPCIGCPTEYPKVCGYRDYDEEGDGQKHASSLYQSFITSLGTLSSTIGIDGTPQAVIVSTLRTTVLRYKDLEGAGCE